MMLDIQLKETESAFPALDGSGRKSLLNLDDLRIMSSLLKSPEFNASQVVQANAMYGSFRRICSSGALGVAAGRVSHEEFRRASGQTGFFFLLARSPYTSTYTKSLSPLKIFCSGFGL